MRTLGRSLPVAPHDVAPRNEDFTRATLFAHCVYDLANGVNEMSDAFSWRSHAAIDRSMTLLFAVFAVLTHVATSQCPVAFGQLSASGLPGPANAVVEFDDGRGPAYWVGTSGGVARWDGATWSSITCVDPSGVLAGVVNALAVHDDGTGPALYAGGMFSSIGGVAANSIAKWNGTTWSPLAGGIPQPGFAVAVRALLSHNEGQGQRLFAAGSFRTAGTTAVPGLARWNGSAWSAVGTATGGAAQMFALAAFPPGPSAQLHVGGGFNGFAGTAAVNVARWNGTSWSAVDPGAFSGSDSVYALENYDDGNGPRLYAGGQLPTLGHIVRLVGNSWTTLGPSLGISASGGVFPSVQSLAAHGTAPNSALFVGGVFTSAGPVSTPNVATWNGTSWAAAGAGLDAIGFFSSNVAGLRSVSSLNGPEVIATGFVRSSGSQGVVNVARFSGGSWSSVGRGLASSSVESVAAMNDGTGPAIYAMGAGTWPAGNTAGGGVVKLGASGWDSAFGTGTTGNGTISKVIQPATTGWPQVIAAGSFFTIGGVAANNVAAWNGTSWAPLGGGLTSGPSASSVLVYDIAMYNDGTGLALFAVGQFSVAGGQTVNHIAKWNGTVWSSVAGGIGGVGEIVRTLEPFTDGSGTALYVGGNFTTVGGLGGTPVVTRRALARLSGAGWSQVGPGITTGDVYELKTIAGVGGSDLFVIGQYTFANGVASLGRYRTGSVQQVAAPAPFPVHDAAIFDDGTGATTYVGTTFSPFIAGNPSGLLRHNGSAWVVAGPGVVDGNVSAVDVLDDGHGPRLVFGGSFNSVGGRFTGPVATYGAETPIAFVAQSAGAGTPTSVTFDRLRFAHEYFGIFSVDICPGPVGSGPYLGLCVLPASIPFIDLQISAPIGVIPFHFLSNGPTITSPPFALATGFTFECLCLEVVGGTLGCVSPVTRFSAQ